MTSATPAATFRDPSGSLALESTYAIRTIRPAARIDVLHFVHSDFYARAVKGGDMVATEVHDLEDSLTLVHPRIPVPTYPWEWTPSQWFAAAQLTLALAQEALLDGWILKDATPLNILFLGSKPVLVDVLSFQRRDPTSAVWLPYGQYLRTFLLPLVMLRLLAWPLALTLFYRDGYEPRDLYRALSWPKRLSRIALWSITLPTWLESRPNNSPASTPHLADPEATRHILSRTFAKLLASTQRALPPQTQSTWADYQSTHSHYTPAQSAHKHLWLQTTLTELHPQTVLDIGANTGEFSQLAASLGASVIALERDPAAAERLFCLSRDRNLSIQTIHADLARPTPPTGWENRESSGLLPRLEQQSDLVLLLAVIHHLLLMEQIPLPAILALCHRLSRRHLVIEWVPPSDPMFQALLRGRDALYGHLSESDLLAATDGLFRTLQRQAIGNGRILLLFERV